MHPPRRHAPGVPAAVTAPAPPTGQVHAPDHSAEPQGSGSTAGHARGHHARCIAGGPTHRLSTQGQTRTQDERPDARALDRPWGDPLPRGRKTVEVLRLSVCTGLGTSALSAPMPPVRRRSIADRTGTARPHREAPCVAEAINNRHLPRSRACTRYRARGEGPLEGTPHGPPGRGLWGRRVQSIGGGMVNSDALPLLTLAVERQLLLDDQVLATARRARV